MREQRKGPVSLKASRGGFAYISILAIALLLLILPVTLFLVGQREGAQDVRSQAAEDVTSANVVRPGYLVDSVYVDADLPDKSLARAEVLWADGASKKIAYLKFDLSSVFKKEFTNATLRLFMVKDSETSVSVLAVSDNSWGSESMTFQSRPPLGQKLVTIPGGRGGEWVGADLTSYVKEHIGTQMSVAVETTSPNGFGFNSMFAPSNWPEIVLQ